MVEEPHVLVPLLVCKHIGGVGAGPGFYSTSETAVEIKSTNTLDSRLAGFKQNWDGTPGYITPGRSWG